MEKIVVKNESYATAKSDEIILRETNTTRLLFKPLIVDNNSKNGVKGEFVYQKKLKNSSWVEHKDLDTRNLKADQFIKIALKTEEVNKLFQDLNKNYMIAKDYGVISSTYTFYEKDEDIQKVIDLFELHENLFRTVIENDENNLLEQTLEWIISNKNSTKMINTLKNLQEKDLDQLNTLVGVVNLKKILSQWEENKDSNHDESYWQSLLKEHTWILSQIFSYPTVVIEEEAYVGGKTVANSAGKVVDFLYKNPFSKDAVLIEIKKPSSQLIYKGNYRTTVYPPHKELVGAVAQVLNYKTTLQREYPGIFINNHYNNIPTNFEVINPCCVVVIGRFDSLDEPAYQYSFELYRKELKNVIVITFDELFDRVKNLIDLLEE